MHNSLDIAEGGEKRIKSENGQRVFAWPKSPITHPIDARAKHGAGAQGAAEVICVAGVAGRTKVVYAGTCGGGREAEMGERSMGRQ